MATDAVGLRAMDGVNSGQREQALGQPRTDRPLSARQAAIVWVVSALVGWCLTVAVVWVFTQLL